MKTKLSLTVLLSFSFYLLSSQIPQGFNYQAIARDGSGNPITNATIKVKLSILTDTSGFYVSGGGTYVWEEEQTGIKTNAFGLFTVVFGDPAATKKLGTAASFSAIDWAKGPFYIGTKIANPTDYKNLGAAKLWSVPYSMVSDSTKSLLKGSKLSVVSSNDASTDALFEVKRKDGQTVFAVYPEAVNIYLPRATSKGLKGGFAIGGFDGSKINPQDYFRVTPDSVRVYIDKTPVVKGTTKGGFAIGGFDQSKGGGGGIQLQDLLTVGYDSIRMYINDLPTKGTTKGGFAIGGFAGAKGVSNFMNISTAETGIINPAVNRIVWYPLKNAFLTGNVLVTDPNNVGINSFASGYQSMAKGQYSQALGFQAVAIGDYSTAIGKNASANYNNSFAFGDNASSSNEGSFALGSGAVASGLGSYAFGIDCKALGQNSFAFGDNSQAQGSWTYAIGYHNVATWGPSYAFGDGTKSLNWGATSMGWATRANANHSLTLGHHTISKTVASLVMGIANDTTAMHTDSWDTWHSDDPVLIIGNGDVDWNGSEFVVTNRKNALTVLKSGATGINMNYPSYMLDVDGEITSRNGNAIRIRNSSYSSIFHQDASDLYLLVSNSGDPDGNGNSFRPLRMNYSTGNVYLGSNNSGSNYSLTVQSNGKVGIGTQTPDQNLTLSGNMKFTDGYPNIMNGYNKYILQSGWNGTWYNFSMLSSSWDWSGTKSPGSIVVSEQYPLVVTSGNNGTPNATTQLSVDNNGDIYMPNIQTSTSGSGSGVTFLQWGSGGKLIKYSISSSRRYKDDITELENIDWIYKLRPVRYVFKTDPSRHREYGLIAEEVENINPELVVYNDKNEVESVSYNSLIAPLIKSAQDQENKIESLVNENKSIKSELQSLKEEVEQMKTILSKAGVK